MDTRKIENDNWKDLGQVRMWTNEGHRGVRDSLAFQLT